MQKLIIGENDIASQFPNIATEWDYEKNYPIKPNQICIGSSKKYWWKCKQGHSFQQKVHSRTRTFTDKTGKIHRPQNCPYCSNQKILPGYNDLASSFPNIANEWNHEKNIKSPSQVGAKSKIKYWWKCKHGHEWLASIDRRTYFHNGCPFCSNKKILKGYNDLVTTNPEIAAEWHPTKNGNLTPYNTGKNSQKNIWWLCPKGHEYQSRPLDRYQKKCGCPICSGHKLLTGYNDLKTLRPDLAAEWHPTKNGNLSPDEVARCSMKKVWWLGKCGHEWDAKIAGRSFQNQNCPICRGLRILKGHNDLATTSPEIAAEWHPTKNGKLKPTDVTQGSDKKIFWQCKQGHEWKTSITSRTNKKTKCPYCARPNNNYAGFKNQFLFEIDDNSYFGATCTICNYQAVMTPSEMLEHQNQYHNTKSPVSN